MPADAPEEHPPAPSIIAQLQTPPPRPAPAPRAFPRGIYGSDSTATGYDAVATRGFNLVEVSPSRGSLDALTARGLRGFVWLGGWDNTTCTFEYGDQRVHNLVAAIAGHPALQFYYVGDEPYYSACPEGPAAYRQRTALIHSIDSGTPTYTVIAAWDEGANEEFPYGHWVGAADILGLDIYPCVRGDPVCDFGLIDRATAKAAQVGVRRYYGVIQAFQDDYYRLPTPAELHEEFAHWRPSRMEGYLVFSWNYAGSSLEAHPDLLLRLGQENAG